MPSLARAAVAVLLLAMLAGCNGPSKPAIQPMPSPAPVAAPTYDVTIVVTQETPDGKPMQASVQAYPLLPSGGLGAAMAQGTDTQGAARFTFREPTTLLVRALGPGGWTQEGAKVHVAADAVAAEGVTVSDRDVFLPLFRDRIDQTLEHAWSTAVAERAPDGSTTPARTFAALALPAGLELAYLARLSDAAVQATWMDGTEGHAATLSAGFAWDGTPWVEGAESSALEVGPRKAAWDGDLPAERPVDLGNAHLQAMLGTTTAVVGDILVELDASLTFGGLVPAGLPEASCPGHLLVPC